MKDRTDWRPVQSDLLDCLEHINAKEKIVAFTFLTFCANVFSED